MNMQQPDPAGLFDQYQGQRKAAPSNNSVTAQISNRPVPSSSVPPVQPSAPVQQPAAPVSDQPVNPFLALYESGAMEKSIQAAEQENPFKKLYDSGVMTQSVLAAEDEQYKKNLVNWEKRKKEFVPYRGMGVSDPLPQPLPPARELKQIEKDYKLGVKNLRGQELGGILNQIESGNMTPEQEAIVTRYIEPSLPPEFRRQLQISRVSRDKLLDLQQQAQTEEQQAASFAQESLYKNPYQLAQDPRFGAQSEQANVFGRSVGKMLTANYAFAPDEDRLNSDNIEEVADERAKRQFYKQQQAKYPGTDLAGNIVGALAPMGLTGMGLRAAKVGLATKALKAGPPTAGTAGMIAARGAPQTALGTLVEGAAVGGIYDAASRPEGSEDMSLEQNLNARLQQVGFGLVLGGAFDLGLMGAGKALRALREAPGKAINKVQTKRLDKTAKDLGYDNFNAFADAHLEVITDEAGQRIRLKQDVLDALPEEQKKQALELIENAIPGAKPDATQTPEISRAEQDVAEPIRLSEATAQEKPTERPPEGEIEETVQGRTEPTVKDEIEEPSAKEEPPTELKIKDYEIVEAPINELTLSSDVPQFKAGANQQGVVEPLGGTFERTGVAPIQVWVREDGTKEIISGRHRFDLAKRSGEETIPAQYHYESEGFSKQQAASLDATLNIREGQGKVKDYVEFIQTTKPTKEEADAEGILGRATGRRAYTIATEGSDALIAAHSADQLTDEAATRIARAAPGSERLQSVGIKAIQDGKTITVAENMVKAVRTMTDDTAPKSSGDMFGFDDSALKEAEALARKAAAKQADIQKTLSAVQGAAKNPERAAKEGVDVKDPEAVKRRIEELKQEKQDWQNWHTNPDLVAELKGEKPSAKQEPAPKAEPEPPPKEQEGFDLTTQTEAELTAKEKATQEADQLRDKKQQDLEAKAKADTEAKDFELGLQGSGKDVSSKQDDLLGLGTKGQEKQDWELTLNEYISKEDNKKQIAFDKRQAETQRQLDNLDEESAKEIFDKLAKSKANDYFYYKGKYGRKKNKYKNEVYDTAEPIVRKILTKRLKNKLPVDTQQAVKHKQIIKKALSEGKAVPDSILKYYDISVPKKIESTEIKPEEPTTKAQTVQKETFQAEAQQQAKTETTPTKTEPEPTGDVANDALEIEPITEGTHTKTGKPVFNVKVSTKLGKQKFAEAAKQAKTMGGSYYNGKFALPTRKKAEEFITWLNGETIDRTPARMSSETKVADQQADRMRKEAEDLEAKQNKQVEGLRKKADTLEAKGEADYSQERLTNTPKRLSQATSARAIAEKTIRFAQTLRNIANGIEDGSIRLLNKLNSLTQLETLNSLECRAIPHDLMDSNYDGYSMSHRKKEGVTLEDYIDKIELPTVNLSRDKAVELIAAMKNKKGFSHARGRLETQVSLATRNSNQYIKLPAHGELTVKLDEFVRKYKADPGWQFKDSMKEIKQLQRLGITTDEQLRGAIRELETVKAKSTATSTDHKLDAMRLKIRQNAGNFNDFFPTPEATTNRVLELADVQPGMKTLEPNAGMGHIAEKLQSAAGKGYVDLVEMSGQLVDYLKTAGHKVTQSDFLKFGKKDTYDRIVMNPPFSKDQDIDHVMHAYDLLKPGGKMTAIMSNMAGLRANQKNRTFSEWLDEVGAHVEDLEAGSFKSSFNPTSVNTKVVVIEKPKAPVKAEITDKASQLLKKKQDRFLKDKEGDNFNQFNIATYLPNYEFDEILGGLGFTHRFDGRNANVFDLNNIEYDINKYPDQPTYYHGTKSDFDKFDLNKKIRKHFGEGIWFSKDLEHAKTYAGENGRVMSVKIKGKPWDYDVTPELIDAVEKKLFSKNDDTIKPPVDTPTGTTLYSAPVIPAAKQVAKMLHLNPAGSVGGAVYGGITADQYSEEENFSKQWWLDVLFGAAGGAVVGAGGTKALTSMPIRGKPLLSKQGYAMDVYDFIGRQFKKIPGMDSGNKEVLTMGKQQQLMKALIERQAEKAGEYLLKNFTPAERSTMADLIEERGIVAEGNLLHRQAKELDDFISYTGKKLQDLGMLDKDIELGGYMHRYYSKHLNIGGLTSALTTKGKSISGSWSIRRGTQEVFDSKYMSQSMRDTMKQVTDLQAEYKQLSKTSGDLVGTDTQARLDDIKAQLNDLQSIEFREYMAPENGQLKSFFMAADEVPIIPGLKNRPKTGLPEPARQGNLEGMKEPPKTGSTGELALTDRRWTIDGMNSGKKGESGILHRDWTKPERESWGEINDVAYRTVRGQAEVAHDLSLGTFFKEVNDQFQGTKVSDTEIEGWHKVPDTKVGKNGRMKRYGALSGKYVTDDIWKAVKHQGRNPLLTWTNNHPAVKTYLNGLGKWKAYKTVYNPVSHMNNSVGNLQMYYLSDYEGKHLARAFSELRKGEDSALVREARNSGLFGTDWTSTLTEGTGNKTIDDLLEKLRTQSDIPDFDESLNSVMGLKQWFIESSNAVKNAQGSWKTGAELAKAVGNPLINTARKPINKAANAMQAAYRMEDEFFKMAVYLAERQKGTKPFEAVQAANRYFFDYGEMPTGMKVVRDFPIGSPFISYTYFAIPSLVKTAIEKPEKILALAAALEGVNYASMMINDELEEQGYWDRMADEKELYPSWMQGRSMFGSVNNVSIPFMEGYKLSLANANVGGNPFIGNADRTGAWPSFLSFWGTGAEGSNPFSKLIFDVTRNEDWRGNPIWMEGAPSSEKVRKAANYVYQNVTPSNPLFPGSYHQQKLIEGASNIKRKAEEEGEQPNMLVGGVVDLANATSEILGGGQFTGLDRSDNEILFRDALFGSMGAKLRPVRVDQFEQSRQWDIKKKMDDKAKWIRKQETFYEENRITESQIEQSRLEFNATMAELEQRADRLSEAASNQKRAMN